MNPIEHIWYLLKTRINKRKIRFKTVEKIKDALLEKWEKLKISTINLLINSIPYKVQVLIAFKVRSIKY